MSSASLAARGVSGRSVLVALIGVETGTASPASGELAGSGVGAVGCRPPLLIKAIVGRWAQFSIVTYNVMPIVPLRKLVSYVSMDILNSDVL